MPSAMSFAEAAAETAKTAEAAEAGDDAAEFAGKVTIVTGAARGVRKETVALLNARGVHVVAVDLRPDVKALPDEFPGVLAMTGDITHEATAAALKGSLRAARRPPRRSARYRPPSLRSVCLLASLGPRYALSCAAR
ncbi:hypothetical protein [Streptomyces zagrosensis]|uniref:NAD(P)-dependent dehydrogenase (Short-subunit alcohol dehydrogenase family) n=1 Tax=Streptomyces zagrosensis TaxID=1042984 RepID=A0A7W9V098_9ACTN|nr:hypothetical protein [Streptomyces zagrosensis]MBB5937592.1 NAD(P)-dependent dehydrogenase (short-subunit alcohol dehydrogenase family) [Streptomyces zagrosensis]